MDSWHTIRAMPIRRHMMERKLSHVLLDLGLFCALGTTERSGVELKLVKKGMPYTTDTNNGVSVVYDEAGRPWVMRLQEAGSLGYPGKEIQACLDENGKELKRGAYVPHSNDGGHFMREVLPMILRSVG